MIFKRMPRDYQLEDFERSKDLRNFALLFEMGLGKSKVTNDTALHLYSKGKINAVAIIAPKGIHAKWAKEDFPADFPDSIDYRAAVWRSGNQKSIDECERLFNPGERLRVLCMNIEALSQDKGPAEKFLIRFLQATDCMLVVDESDTIKNPDAKRTKRLLKLGDKASYKRILTGTPINNSVFDLYSQMTFLDTDIFGQSFTSFKHTYAEVLPPTHPTMMAIMRKGARFAPVLVDKDADGKPKWKNLDKLKEVMKPYCAIRLKKDHSDLPDKIYQSIYYDLERRQRRLYDELKLKAKIALEDDTVTVLHKMTLIMRLQQVLSGYLPGDTTDDLIPLFNNPKDNPRIEALLTLLETVNGQVIIWCRFVDEIKQIAKLLGDECITYFGETKNREETIELFKTGKVRYMVANTAVGGAGLNLSNSATTIYYSNDFSYRNRAQSEDRQHRIGQTETVTCIDVVASDTVDEHITKILRDKKDISAEMMSL
jgi:SNF2 family DNA or RNA helicase